MGYFRSSYKINRIDAKTTLIIEKLFGAPCYIYVVEGSDRAAVIDTGLGGGNLLSEVRKITDKELIVLNTHGHFDHFGGNAQFEKVYVSESDLPLLRLHQDKRYFDKMLPWIVRFILAPPLKKVLGIRHTETYEFITDGQILDLGGRELEVIATPGHSVGSVCFADTDNGYLFSGDMVVAQGVLLNLCGSTDVATFLSSMKKLKARSQDWVKCWAGHHDIGIGSEYIDKYICCAEMILSGKYRKKPTRGGFDVAFENIKIALPRDPRVLEIPEPGKLPYLDGMLI